CSMIQDAMEDAFINESVPSSAEKKQLRHAIRKKFAAVDDVVLLRAVNAFRPWRAPVGTSNGIMKVFEDIAFQCGADPDFGVDKPGVALRTRFGTLMKEFKRDQCRSMRKSGTVEQYEERDRLLVDITTQVDDWNTKVTADNKVKEAKQLAIENSGDLMRRIAMNEIDEDDTNTEDDDISTDGKYTQARQKLGKKRLTRPGSAQKGKITKRERLAVVMDALTESLKSASGKDNSKYEYKTQRLAFEKEQANLQLKHKAE
ncbi:hypothetical protein L917_07808, partial [Phytophthora nicotianae]